MCLLHICASLYKLSYIHECRQEKSRSEFPMFPRFLTNRGADKPFIKFFSFFHLQFLELDSRQTAGRVLPYRKRERVRPSKIARIAEARSPTAGAEGAVATSGSSGFSCSPKNPPALFASQDLSVVRVSTFLNSSIGGEFRYSSLQRWMNHDRFRFFFFLFPSTSFGSYFGLLCMFSAASSALSFSGCDSRSPALRALCTSAFYLFEARRAYCWDSMASRRREANRFRRFPSSSRERPEAGVLWTVWESKKARTARRGSVR